MRLARVLGALGRTCITVGTLLLLFVAYQLWGTGIREAQAQHRLKGDYLHTIQTACETSQAKAKEANSDTLGCQPPNPKPAIAAVEAGQPTALIKIPKISVNKVVVEGVALPDLKKGPGHYPGTPLPGQKGNAAIAGHRTTYGAPFNRIDELKPGDKIFTQTVQGSFTYIVKETKIVSPSAVEVLNDFGDNRLTLTACHPKYSAAKRIVVVSELGPNQHVFDATKGKKEGNLSGVRGEATPALLLGLLCGLIWLLAWALGRLWRRWPSYLLGLPFFMVALYYFFENFSRLLPANI
jgi:sortase A